MARAKREVTTSHPTRRADRARVDKRLRWTAKNLRKLKPQEEAACGKEDRADMALSAWERQHPMPYDDVAKRIRWENRREPLVSAHGKAKDALNGVRNLVDTLRDEAARLKATLLVSLRLKAQLIKLLGDLEALGPLGPSLVRDLLAMKPGAVS